MPTTRFSVVNKFCFHILIYESAASQFVTQSQLCTGSGYKTVQLYINQKENEKTSRTSKLP